MNVSVTPLAVFVAALLSVTVDVAVLMAVTCAPLGTFMPVTPSPTNSPAVDETVTPVLALVVVAVAVVAVPAVLPTAEAIVSPPRVLNWLTIRSTLAAAVSVPP